MEREVKQQIPDGRVITMKANMKLRSVKVRIKRLRNCVFVFEHPERKYPTPHPCAMCKTYHTHKAYHLPLDANGETVVNEQLYQRLKDAGLLDEMVAVKEVVPRPIAIGLEFVDYQNTKFVNGLNEDPLADNPAAPQPPTVVSQTKGLIKEDGKLVGGT